MDKDRRSRRFKVHGRWEGGKPNYRLVEYNPNTGKWETVGGQKVNSTLKELKQLLIEMYPDYRFYNYTTRKDGYRYYFALPPDDPEAKRGWIN